MTSRSVLVCTIHAWSLMCVIQLICISETSNIEKLGQERNLGPGLPTLVNYESLVGVTHFLIVASLLVLYVAHV